MPRYVAFLRGVSPMNARMPELKACFEQLGFTDVRTVQSSGNVVFSTNRRLERTLASTIESGLARHLPRGFPVIVRSCGHLRALIAADPHAAFGVTAGEKRIVTFLARPHEGILKLPLRMEGARILAMTGEDVFSAYVPGDNGPVFMTLIEKTFGKAVTTRTLDTLRRCVAEPGPKPARPAGKPE